METVEIKETRKLRRNGKIDFMRFVFCITVIILHIEGVLYNGMKSWGIFSMAHRGYIGVEFFFLLSGWLLAKKLDSMSNVPCTADTLGGETYRYLWGKLRPIIPYHIIFTASMLIGWAICYPDHRFVTVLSDRIPSLFFLHRFGFDGTTPKDVLGIEWYIFSMLMCMSFLYPLGRRFGRVFRSLAPITGLLICGSLIIKTGCLNNVNMIVGFTYKCNFRALGELLIGMGCYEATCALNRKTFTKWGRFGLSCLEIGCLIAGVYYAYGVLGEGFDMHALAILAVAVIIAFSNKGFASGSKLWDNDFCVWLGKLSMPIYLAQAPWLSFLPLVWKDATNRELFFGILVGSVITGIIAYTVIEFCKKKRT